MRTYGWTKEEDCILAENYGKLTVKEIHNLLLPNKSMQAIFSHATKKLKLQYREKQFKFNWSHDMAYCVGMIASDGCLSSRENWAGYQISIDLHKKDSYILDKMQEVLGGKRFELPKKNMSCLRIYSKSLYEQLNALGITSKKAKTIEYIKVPDEYERSFIRGYFDGDGSIFICKSKYLERYGVNFCGSEFLLNGLRLSLIKNAGIGIGPSVINGHGCMQIAYSKKDTIKLYHYMYDNSCNDNGFFLSRKKQRFEDLIARESARKTHK